MDKIIWPFWNVKIFLQPIDLDCQYCNIKGFFNGISYGKYTLCVLKFFIGIQPIQRPGVPLIAPGN